MWIFSRFNLMSYIEWQHLTKVVKVNAFFVSYKHKWKHTLRNLTCAVLLDRKGLVFLKGSVGVRRVLISKRWWRSRV